MEIYLRDIRCREIAELCGGTGGFIITKYHKDLLHTDMSWLNGAVTGDTRPGGRVFSCHQEKFLFREKIGGSILF